MDFYGDGWWRPAATEESAKYYVFLNTLSEDDPLLYNMAQRTTDLMGELNGAEVQEQIDTALVFLHKMIANERVKENNFLAAHKDEIGTLGDYDFILDGMELIKKINYAIQGVELTNAVIDSEKKRMTALTQRVAGQKISPPWSASQAFQGTAQALINSLSGKGSESTAGFKARNAKIVEEILKNIDSQLKSNGKNGAAAINNMDLFTSVFTLQISALEILNGSSDFTFQDMMKSPAFANMYNNLIDAYTTQGQALQEFTSRMKKQFDNLGFKQTQSNLASKNLWGNYTWLTNEARRNLKNKNKQGQSYREQFSKELETALANLKNFSMNVEIVQKKGIAAEEISAAIQGAMGTLIKDGTFKKAYATGATGTVTDTISLDIKISDNSATQKIDDLIQKMTEDDLKKKHEEFYRQNENIRRRYEQIEQTLAERKKENSDLEKCFILHDNIKDYATIGGVGAKTRSFSGGEWSVAPFMTYLRSLAELGFAPQDLTLIEFAIINTAPGAVLSGNKNPIENFISIFIALTLFSDGINMANEIAMGLTANQTTLNTLHLFYVNHLYVPASYVLEIIYNEMSNKKMITDKGAKAHIGGGLKDPKEKLNELTAKKTWGRARWREFREAELDAVKISIQFLGNFFDIVNSF